MDQHIETLFFQQCRTLDGHIQSIQVGRRNGRLIAILPPDWDSLESLTDPAKDEARIAALRQELSINLNPVESRTWNQLINERTVAEIAREERKSRTAIYERIRGNSKGQGGMIAKNPYVAFWWCQRQKAGKNR